MASFINCKYQWQLQETLKEHFDSLSLQNPEDFGKVAQAILGACEDFQSSEEKKRANHIDTLSDVLKIEVQNILNYLDAPNENISVQFVNENQHLFGLKEFISQEEAFAAYQELVKNILVEIASDFKNTSQEERKNIIAQKEAQLKKKQEEQLQLKAKKAPLPGSENSTHQFFLTNLLGGAEKVNELILKFKAEPSISDFRSSGGNIEGVLTDEEGLRWRFECNADDDEKFVIIMKNYDALRLSIQEPAKSISANEVTMIIALPSSTFPSGQFQYQTSTIKDVLLTRIQEIAYISFCVAFGKMNNINNQILNRKIDEIAQSRNYPPRAQIKEMILALGQQTFELDVISGFLAQVLQALHQNPGEEESAGEVDGPDVVSFPQGVLPGLRAYLLQNRPAADEAEAVPHINPLAVQGPVVAEPNEVVVHRRNPRRTIRDMDSQRRRF